MAKWEGDKKLEKRLIELHGRGLGFGDIAKQLSEEFDQEFSVKSVDSRIFVLREEGKLGSWVDLASIGAFDIETANLEANSGHMLSWSFTDVRTGETTSDCITRAEIINGLGDDSRIIKSLVNELKKYDVILGFWSTNFDVPYVRARALGQGIDFPIYGSVFHIDVFYAARSLMKLHRRSLQAATEFLGIEGKTHLDMNIWRKARLGHEESLEYVVEHNRSDTEILAALWLKLKPYRKWIRKSI